MASPSRLSLRNSVSVNLTSARGEAVWGVVPEGHVFEVVQRDGGVEGVGWGRGIGGGLDEVVGPVQLGPIWQAAVVQAPAALVDGAAVELTDRADLRWGQARISVLAGRALDEGGVESALPRVGDDPMRVTAGRDHGRVQRRDLAGGQDLVAARAGVAGSPARHSAAPAAPGYWW